MTVVDFSKPGTKKGGANGAHMPDAEYFGDAASDAPAMRSVTTAEVVRRWKSEGTLVRVPTGFPTFDEACRGGLPIPWRVSVVGAPSAGKTAVASFLGRRLASESGLEVGIMASDEEDDDHAVRQAQMAGFTIAECEARDPETLARMEDALADLHVHFYGPEWTIEAAAEDLARHAQAAGRRAALIGDSLHTVRSTMSGDAKSPRELVEANIRGFRTAATRHRMLVIVLAEDNRNAYRSERAAEESDDMAAGAESRSIEFFAQTLMVLRTPKGYPDVVHVRVPKNRRGARTRFEFWLSFDRERHGLTECSDPTALDAEHDAVERAQKDRKAVKAAVIADAVQLAAVVRANPGIGERAMRAKLKANGHGWGPDRIDAAKEVLLSGWKGDLLVDRGEKRPGMPTRWHLERVTEGGES